MCPGRGEKKVSTPPVQSSAAHRPTLFEDLSEAVGKVPGVQQVAVVAETVTRAGDHRGLTAARTAPASEPGRGTQPPRRPVQPSSPVDPSSPVGRSRPAAVAYGGDPPDLPGFPRTLQEALRQAAGSDAATGLTYLRADGSCDVQSYRELMHEAQRVLGGLHALGLRPGDCVLFQMDDNRSFITVFWACVLGGYLPTPVAPAPGYQQGNDVTRKLHAAWELLDHPVVVTDEQLLAPVHGLAGLWEVDGLRVMSAERLLRYDECADWFPAGPDDPVLHLLTSGSTGTPKCVRHANRSILAMIEGVSVVTGIGEHDVTLNWMPMDHVGGLVMTHVRDVALRCRQINAKLGPVLADPLLWLGWVQTYSVTNTWAPNFMFALVNELADEVGKRSWDLSSLRHITNGGEAVVARTAHRFLGLMRPHGLPGYAMRPAWGMSETASGVTFSRLDADDERVGTLAVDPESLSGGDLRLLDESDGTAVILTEVGPPIPGVRLRIVDQHGTVLPEGTVGRLQIAGATVMSGYHRNTEANQASFTEDGWFDTGDLAFLLNGKLTITGREKDLVIIRGANHLASDIESLVEQVEGVEPGSVAATAYRDSAGDTDRMALFFVSDGSGPGSLRPTVARIRTKLLQEIGLYADTVVPLAKEELPRTAKGTVQRARLRTALDEGAFADRLREFDGGDQGEDEPQGALPPWFFEKEWCGSVDTDSGDPGHSWVLFEPPDSNLGWQLREALRAGGGALTIVRPGEDFAQDTDGSMRIRPGDASHYERLLGIVDRRQNGITTVVHGWGLGRVADRPDPEALRASLDTGVLSLLLLLRHLAPRNRVRLLALTTDAVWARPGDRPDWAQGAVQGLVRTADAEATLPSVRQLDLSTTDRERWAEQVLREAALNGHAPTVARRGTLRLVPRFRGAAVDPGLGGSALVPGGVYLLTGGLGGIGYELAQHLLASYQARLLIVGREPVTAGMPDTKGARLACLRELGEVRYAALDVADPRSLVTAVESAEHAWRSRLAGVLHLASADMDGAWWELERHTVTRSSPEEYLRMYQAKLLGTAAIGQLLEDRPDCMLVLFSSVNAEFGGSSFGAYASANSFLGGFADYWGRTRGRPVRCMHWSMWSGIGMNQGSPLVAAARRRGFRPITAVHGIASFLAVLAYDNCQLLIGLDGGNPSVQRELADDQLSAGRVVVAYSGGPQVGEAELRRAAAEVPGVDVDELRFVHVSEIPTDGNGQIDRWQILEAVALRSRNGGRSHEEPGTDLERVVARIWGDVLGAVRIGLDDTFFELGGNSLKGTQLVAELGAGLGLSVGVHHLYDNPTVRRLTALLENFEEAGRVIEDRQVGPLLH